MLKSFPALPILFFWEALRGKLVLKMMSRVALSGGHVPLYP